MSMRAAARAHTNIALIKYWGKRDSALMLPMNSSISMTLDAFYTETQVVLDKTLLADEVWLNGEPASVAFTKQVVDFLNKVRQESEVTSFVKVFTVNHVPTAAGLASSASGFAALAAASSKVYGLSLDPKALSILARKGSGSASRSIFGGFVKWHKGNRADGLDAFSEPLYHAMGHWPLEFIAVIVEDKAKDMSSRNGMAQSVATSPLYSGWLESIEADIERAEKAILSQNLKDLGEVMEHNTLKMHATMMTATPPFIYWTAGTLSVMHAVKELRTQGIETYFTIDAGANVKVLCHERDTDKVNQSLQSLPLVQQTIKCKAGPGVQWL